jgi:hypothetical protein
MSRPRFVLICAIAALGLAQPAAASKGLFVGASEDAPRSVSIVHAKAKMDLAALAGFDAIRVTSIWKPGEREPSGHELVALQNVSWAADLNGIRLILSVYHAGSKTTPLKSKARSEFTAYLEALARELPGVNDFIVGNEPNLNRFWLPQFTRSGGNAAAPGYVDLLARSYDTLKAVSRDIQVIGGAVSPRGSDNYRLKRHTHSPTKFILDMGAAYRRSGRKRPIMDAFALHPYLLNSRLPPTRAHPNSTSIGLADYDKLVGLLGRAFDGTAQPGSRLPIIYAEFGVQTKIPAQKRRAYTNLKSRVGRDAVAEKTQAAYYRQALSLAYCQPNVRGILLLHVTDEPQLERWQSGLFYADDTPKSSFGPVKRAIDDVRTRKISSCGSADFGVSLEAVDFPTQSTFPAGHSRWGVEFTCRRSCRYVARIERLGERETVLTVRGTSEALEHATASFPSQALPPATYRYALSFTSLYTQGELVLRTSEPFRVVEPPPDYRQ